MSETEKAASKKDIRTELLEVASLEEETRLEAREIAARRHAAKRAAEGAQTWAAPAFKLDTSAVSEPPNIFAVLQPDGSYKSIGRRGRWHLLFGASGSGKTFLAVGLAAEILRTGDAGVMWVDFEDQGADLGGMFRSFGIHGEVENFHGFSPEVPPDVAEVVNFCQEHGIALVVLDAQRGAVRNAVPGIEDEGKAVEAFSAELIRPLTRAGITVVSIDHVAKSGSGGMPIGSERKFSACDVVFEVESVADVHESAELGYSKVTVRKFRGGAFRKADVPAHLVYRNGRATIELQPVKPSLAGFAEQSPMTRDRAVKELVAANGLQFGVRELARAVVSAHPELFQTGDPANSARGHINRMLHQCQLTKDSAGNVDVPGSRLPVSASTSTSSLVAQLQPENGESDE